MDDEANVKQRLYKDYELIIRKRTYLNPFSAENWRESCAYPELLIFLIELLNKMKYSVFNYL